MEPEVSVRVRSREGTAKENLDYKPVDEIITFAPGETEKEYKVEIIDDAAYEEDEEFFLDLSHPECKAKSNDFKTRIRAGLGTVTMIIVDDDEPGQLRFQHEQVEVKDP